MQEGSIKMSLTGIIAIWSGSIASIPTGWKICDGNNGTPDLRNRFVVGAGDTYAVDANGGAIAHTHPFTGDGHTHDIPGGPSVAAGTDFDLTSSSEPATGTTGSGGSLPPYYALAFIMKT